MSICLSMRKNTYFFSSTQPYRLANSSKPIQLLAFIFKLRNTEHASTMSSICSNLAAGNSSITFASLIINFDE